MTMVSGNGNENGGVGNATRLGIDDDAGGRRKDKGRQRKGMVVAIVVIIVALSAVGWHVGNRVITHDDQNAVIDNATNVNQDADDVHDDNGQDNGTNVSGGGTSTDTTTTDVSGDADENAVDDGRPKHGASSASIQATKDAERYMQAHDVGSLGNTAANFLRSFFTYDQTTLGNGSWLSLCSSYVDQDGIKGDTDNVVYRRIADTDWCKRMSNYGLFAASVDSVDVRGVYATKSESTRQGTIGEYHPVADVVITCNVTNDEPGNVAWWDGLSKRRVEYLVNFTQDDKVAGISKISDKVLEVIRATTYMDGMTQ